MPEPLSENNSNKIECCGRASIIPTAVTPLLIASRQVLILGIIPPVIVSFLIISKISEEDTIPSVTNIYPSANWYEREAFDMYGINFTDHPDLRRLLTDYNFEGYPLRKDFPLTGSVEVRYSEIEKKVIYEPVKLQQDYRNFDIQSPWEGTKYESVSEIKEGDNEQ